MTDQEMQALTEAMEQIYALAAEFKLDPYPMHWEVVPAGIMYEFGAYGLPGRYSHWTHGKAYASMKMQYDYGLSKIYELVINTDPCYAFLMETNQPIQNKPGPDTPLPRMRAPSAALPLGYVAWFRIDVFALSATAGGSQATPSSVPSRSSRSHR